MTDAKRVDKEYWYTPNMHQVWEDHENKEIRETFYSQACNNKVHIRINETGVEVTIIDATNKKVLAMCGTRMYNYERRLR